MNKNIYKVVAIIGKSGSGKDTLLKNFLKDYTHQNDIHKIVSYTTRPPRENEENGKEYFFVSKEEFAEKVLSFEMLEAAEFRNWHYGTGLQSLDKNKVNIGIFDPERVSILADNPLIELYIIEVRTSAKERLLRQLTREDDPDINEIFRRYNTDENDFYDLDLDTYIVFNENEEELKVCINFLKSVVNTIRPDLDVPLGDNG